MKHLFTFITAVITLACGISVEAGKPSSEEHRWSADMSGAVSGQTLSNWTDLKGRIQNLVFNKAGLGSYALSNYFLVAQYDQGNGASCFDPAGFNSGTMQLYNDDQAEGLTARFWFVAKGSNGQSDVQYVLELFDTAWDANGGETGPFWSGNFLPLAGDGAIRRTAESWSLRPTKRNVKNACEMEYANFDDPADYVRVELECATCQ